MIIYLYGPDSYRRREKLNWYLGKFREKHSTLTVERFDLAETNGLHRLKDFATAQSLFDDFKFGVLDNVGEAEPKQIQGIFKISGDSKSLTLAISADKPLTKDFKIPVEKPNIVEEFEVPTAAAFTAFARKEAEKRGLKLTPAALDGLVRNYTGDEYGLITDLEKIALGASPEPFTGKNNFFALATVLQSEGPASYKLPALERLLQDDEPAAIFNFVASRANSELKTKMADLDVAIKSGKTEYEEALLGLAISD